VINLNLTAMFAVTQEVGRRSMVPRRQGKIVNVASTRGLGGGSGDDRQPATLAYNTSKGGVVNFTRALAVEWGRYNINVNAICPGYISTEINAEHFQSEQGKALVNLLPRKRVGEPQDLDGLLLLLASDEAHFINGAIMTADDGMSAS
jgi:NAD(P)-dependent dehydrogenase (short-subunit alcohol dehydrogenase family)